MAKTVEVKITDNSKTILSEFQKQVAQGLEAIGLAAEGYAKDNCPVDTGRLRNSITYATEKSQGTPNTRMTVPGGKVAVAAKEEDYALHGKPEKNEVVIGTNVEYAPAMEFRDLEHKTGKAHFLRDAVSNHTQEYKKTLEAALKG